MSDKIRTVRCKPGCDPEIVMAPNGYQALSDYVEGWIEAVGVGPGVVMYLNEEGRITGMPFNRMVTGTDGAIWDIYGPIWICGCNDEGEDVSLTPEQARYWEQVLRDGSQDEPKDGRNPRFRVTVV